MVEYSDIPIIFLPIIEYNLDLSFPGNVPCPIIYGAVVDSACLFWEDNCGEPGACRLYDPSKFRGVFHGVTAVIMCLAFFVDLIVCKKAESIQFQEEEVLAIDVEETVPFNETLQTTLHSDESALWAFSDDFLLRVPKKINEW